MMNTNGLKFNSACNITFHCNVFLQDFIGGTGYNILTENFGQIHLTGNASFIAGNMGNIFYNYPNASILVENGFLNLGDISGYNVCWFWNQGTITLLNGNINIPYGSLLDNYGKVIINGSLLGFDSSILECGFINDAPNSVLSVTKDIFPPSNKGTLTCTGMNGLGLPIEPNYIIYNGTTNQTILLPTQPFDPSSPLPYSVLVVDNIAGVTLNSDITVTDTLSLINGLVHLGNYNLTIGDTAAITGLPSAGNMIVATGTGELRKSFTSTGSFTFPVGDNDGTAEYSPVTLNFTAGTFTGAYAGVNLLNTAYPGVTGNYLNRYWNLSQSGITDFICNPTFQYTVNDVAGTEDNLSCTKVSPLPWITYGLTNTATHVLSATGVTSFSSFTGLKSSTPTTINELENITIGNGVTNCYDATDELRVAGNGTTFEVQAGGSVTLIAGMKISLLPGVQVLAGGYLLGTITTNGQYCGGATPASMVAAGTDGPPAIAETMNFRLYPNPTTGSFTLEQAGESQGQNLKVEIYSMLGERIMTESIIGEKKHQFMLGNVPTGIYLVRIFAGEKVETVKLIKQ
jgi:hypothetical protein